MASQKKQSTKQVESEPLQPFYFPDVVNGTTIMAKNQEEAMEIIKNLKV